MVAFLDWKVTPRAFNDSKWNWPLRVMVISSQQSSWKNNAAVERTNFRLLKFNSSNKWCPDSGISEAAIVAKCSVINLWIREFHVWIVIERNIFVQLWKILYDDKNGINSKSQLGCQDALNQSIAISLIYSSASGNEFEAPTTWVSSVLSSIGFSSACYFCIAFSLLRFRALISLQDWACSASLNVDQFVILLVVPSAFIIIGPNSSREIFSPRLICLLISPVTPTEDGSIKSSGGDSVWLTWVEVASPVDWISSPLMQ